MDTVLLKMWLPEWKPWVALDKADCSYVECLNLEYDDRLVQLVAEHSNCQHLGGAMCECERGILEQLRRMLVLRQPDTRSGFRWVVDAKLTVKFDQELEPPGGGR